MTEQAKKMEKNFKKIKIMPMLDDHKMLFPTRSVTVKKSK
jgi:hypothetical protein